MATVKKCKFCQSEIDAKAKVCPVCKRSLKKHHGCLISVVSIFLIGGGLLWIGQKSSTPKEDPTAVSAPDSEAQTLDTPEKSPDETPTEPSAPDESPTKEQEDSAAEVLSIGSLGTLGDWEITVTDFKFTEKVESDYGSFSPEDGNQYGVAYVSVTNTGKESGRFLPSIGMNDDVQAKILYGDGYEFSAANLLGHSDDLHDSTLNPLTSKNGLIAFQLPQTVADSTDPLTLVFSAGRDKVTFTLR